VTGVAHCYKIISGANLRLIGGIAIAKNEYPGGTPLNLTKPESLSITISSTFGGFEFETILFRFRCVFLNR